MYIPSSKKDVVFAIIICSLTFALVLTWHSRQITVAELETTKFKLKESTDNIKNWRDKVERLAVQSEYINKITLEAEKTTQKLEAKAFHIVQKNTAIMDMIDRYMRQGSLPASMIREYDGILKQ